MKKKILFLFVILTMMCSAQISSQTLMMRAFILITTDVDYDQHIAFVTLTDVGSGYNLVIYCPDLDTGNDICYASINKNYIESKFIEICEDHNTSFPTHPELHYITTTMLEWLQDP